MYRVFIFFLLVLALGFGFAWVADRPGDVELTWQGTQYEASLMTVVAALVALIAAIMIIWAIIRTVLNAPHLLGRWRKQRKKDRGYAALSQGLIAAGSGDATSARKFVKDSTKLLGNAPIVNVLDAQTFLLEGNREKARERFEGMLENDETKLIGLRGLYLEAEKQGAKDAARHYVEEAGEIAPSLPWAGNAKLRYRAVDGDWQGALQALDSNRVAGLIDKDAAKRQRAVLLTAHAMAEEQSDPSKAVKLAKEALKLAPSLVPAAIVGSSALMRNNDLRKASKMIEAVWKLEPHPELANAYVHLRVGDSALDRVKRAQYIANLKANHPEGKIAVAEAAIDAQDWQQARDAMKSVMLNVPTERACLIMADIEEGEHGDKGRMRDWLARAVRAPKDAVWTADGYVSETWLPLSPVNGKVDAFEWRVPVEQLGEDAIALDKEELEMLMAPIPDDLPSEVDEVEEVQTSDGTLSGATATAAAATTGSVIGSFFATKEVDEKSEEVVEAKPEDEVETVLEEVAAETVVPLEDVVATASDEVVESVDSHEDVVEAEVVEMQPSDEIDYQSIYEKADTASATTEIKNDDVEREISLSDISDRQVKFALDRRPDDPGTDDLDKSEETTRKKRFGLF